MGRIPITALIRVDNIIYKQEKATVDNIKEGDLVLDTADDYYGYIEGFNTKDRVIVRHGIVTELGVPIKRLRKLVFTADPISMT